MIARGEIGADILPEKEFIAEKMMISQCILAGKPSICAFQMLKSMYKKKRPTRSEVGDIANAVMDGVGCLVLTNETSIGEYPIEAVNLMHRVCMEAEGAIIHQVIFNEVVAYSRLMPQELDTEETVALAAVNAAYSHQSAAIVCLTTTGRSASIISKYRPSCPILAVTRDSKAARLLALYRSVYPLLCSIPVNLDIIFSLYIH